MSVKQARLVRQVARALEELPLLTEAADRGEIGWSKLRVIVQVATPETEGYWLETARREVTTVVERLVRRCPYGRLPWDPFPEGEGPQPVETELRLRLNETRQELTRLAVAELSRQAGRALNPLEALDYLFGAVVLGDFRLAEASRDRGLAEASGVVAALREAEDRELERTRRAAGMDTPVEPEAAEQGFEERHACAESEQEFEGRHKCAAVAEEEAPPYAITPVADGAVHEPEPDLWPAVAVREETCPGEPLLLLASRPAVPHWVEEASAPDGRPPARGDPAPRRLPLPVPGVHEPHLAGRAPHRVAVPRGYTVPRNLLLLCRRCHRNVHGGTLTVRGSPETGLEWRDARGRCM